MVGAFIIFRRRFRWVWLYGSGEGLYLLVIGSGKNRVCDDFFLFFFSRYLYREENFNRGSLDVLMLQTEVFIKASFI